MKGDRALIWSYLDSQMPLYDFGHLQGVDWGQSRTKNSNFGYCKNSSSSKFFKRPLYNYEDYLRPQFQLNLTLFTRVLAPKPPKMDPIGSWTKKTFFLLGKVKNKKYSEAETWHPESIDGWFCYSLCQNFL